MLISDKEAQNLAWASKADGSPSSLHHVKISQGLWTHYLGALGEETLKISCLINWRGGLTCSVKRKHSMLL